MLQVAMEWPFIASVNVTGSGFDLKFFTESKFAWCSQAVAMLIACWHHRRFRPFQAECINAVMCGRDGVAMLRTGHGKTVIPAVVAALRPRGVVVVIQPDEALLADQASRCLLAHIPCAMIGLHASFDHNAITWRAVCDDRVRIIFVSATVVSCMRSFQLLLTRLHTEGRLSALFVDDVHVALDGSLHPARDDYQKL